MSTNAGLRRDRRTGSAGGGGCSASCTSEEAPSQSMIQSIGSSSARWLGARDYEKCVLLPKVEKVLRRIEEDHRQSNGQEEERTFVLVHPTPPTAIMRRISETEPQFKRLVSALLAGIEVRSMYAAGLFNAMHMRDAFADEDCCKAYSHLCSSFHASKTMGELQKFVRRAVTSGETYGWFAVGGGGDVPFVDLDPIVVYVDPPGEWVARTVENVPLKLTFLFEPGTSLTPVSTVSFMLPRYQSIQAVREHYMRCLHYSSRPSFIASSREEGEGAGKGAGGPQPQVLDETLVNQSAMNHHLESLIRESLATTRVSGPQERVQVQNKLHDYVSRLGSENIHRIRSQELLEKKVELLESRLRHLDGEAESFTPFHYDLPEGQRVDGSFLSVRPFDIAAVEEAYQREWYSVCTGLGADVTSPSGQARAGRRREADSGHPPSGLLGPQQRYREVIANELLAGWAKERKIPLEPASVKHGTWRLEDIASMQRILHPSKLAFLLSQILDIPLEQLWLPGDFWEEKSGLTAHAEGDKPWRSTERGCRGGEEGTA